MSWIHDLGIRVGRLTEDISRGSIADCRLLIFCMGVWMLSSRSVTSTISCQAHAPPAAFSSNPVRPWLLAPQELCEICNSLLNQFCC
jgi:hypothetical protein